jgi:uncharacterized protein YqfB (UPF0267 family)
VAHLHLVRPIKNALGSAFVVTFFSRMLLSLGCQKKTAVTNTGSESEHEPGESTKPPQPADLIGYDGTKVRKSVDHIREANEKHNQQEEMAESGPEQ